MAMADVISRLSVWLGLDTAAFEQGADISEKRLKKMEREFTKLGDKISGIGQKLSIGLTVPLAGIGAAVIKMSGDFEAAMIKVGISSEAGADQMKAMNDLALDLGKSTVFGATEAADAMDMLAKNGVSATEILNGAAKAAVELAAATGSELSPAANAITDVMQQFGLTTEKLPFAVNQITGAVNQSKLDFSDFALAIGQAGGVAGSAGVEFDDFAAALAATSSLFASGSDAGTSFKTFITSLTGNSKQAKEAIASFGLEFFDAAGNMRSMSEIAGELQEKLGGLNEQARTEALKTIFGTDAMRTAVALMQQGAEGIERVRDGIAKTDAAAQSAARLKGFNGQMEELKGAFETLAIRIGQSGVLEALTGFVTGLANFVDKLSEANPGILKFVAIVGTIAAAIGPVLIVVGQLVSLFAPLLGKAALGGLAATIAPALPLIAALAAAGAVIYANWDKIAPVLQDLWKVVSDTLGPPLQEIVSTVTAMLTELWNGPLGEAARTAIKVLGDVNAALLKVFGPVVLAAIEMLLWTVKNALTTMLEFGRGIGSLFEGDLKGALTHFARSIDSLFGGLPGKVIGWIADMVRGIGQWMGAKLNAIWDSVKKKVDAVKGWFYDLYDAVVGHSYIPDMVDQIGVHMLRLDKELVAQARKTTQTAAEAFRELQQEVAGILDRLFPDRRARLTFDSELGALNEELRTGRMNTEAFHEAVAALVKEFKGQWGYAPWLPPAQTGEQVLSAISDGETIEEASKKISDGFADVMTNLHDQAQVTKVAVVKTFKEMADETLSAFSNLANSIKSGGFLGILEAVVGLGLQLGSIGAFGKKIQASINMPKYANGTSWAPGGLALVGERGPEVVTLPQGARVTPNNDLRGLGGGIATIVPSPYFDVVVDGRVMRAAPGIAQAGAQGGVARIQYAQSRRWR